MGATTKMKKNIRCYSLDELRRMKGFNHNEQEEMYKLFKEYNVEVFQPWYSKVTSGPTRRPGYYVTTNKGFDNYVKLHNTIAVLKGHTIAKVKYKEYKSEEPIKLTHI